MEGCRPRDIPAGARSPGLPTRAEPTDADPSPSPVRLEAGPQESHVRLTQFSALGLAAPLLKALAAEGYDTPTPIQAQAIPRVLEGRDVVGAAQTGTGKTAAFSLPILQRLAATPKAPVPRTIRVLILAPTRELASQIEESIRAYGRFLKITSATAFGGVPIGRQRRALSGGLDILVATPGRLLDLVDGGDLKLGTVEVLVLDEADRMLDLGFIHALRRIASLVPAKRQSLFFSATMPKPIRELAARFLHDPVEVAVAPVATAAETVDQAVIMTRGERKPALLAHVLSNLNDRAIVFTRTKHGADKVVRLLERAGIASAAIHGNKSQPQRERALAAFRDGSTPVLIATDIAARGIDVDGVGLVVNYDLPNIAESYVHRIGRTGRAGATGRAIAFCTSEETEFLADIEKLMRRKVPRRDEPDEIVYAAPAAPLPPVQRTEPQGDARRNGGRGRQGPGRGEPSRGGHGRGEGRRDEQAPVRTDKPRTRSAAAGEMTRDARPARDARPPRAEADRRSGEPVRHGEGRDARKPAGPAPRSENRPRTESRPRPEGRQGRGGSFGDLVRSIGTDGR